MIESRDRAGRILGESSADWRRRIINEGSEGWALGDLEALCSLVCYSQGIVSTYPQTSWLLALTYPR